MITVPGQADGSMIRKMIHWAVNQPLIVLLLAVALAGRGRLRLPAHQRRGLSRPGPADHRSRGPVSRRFGRGDRAAGDHSAGNGAGGHAGPEFACGASRCSACRDCGTSSTTASITGRPGRRSSTACSSCRACRQGVVPQISPESPTGEIFRYSLASPKDAAGRDIYTLNDLKALQDWTLEREFRRVPRIADITSFGGTVKRYEIHPDPDRLKRYGITLAAIAKRGRQQQRQRRRRLPLPGAGRAERAEHRPDRRRPGPDAGQAALSRPRASPRRPTSCGPKRTAGSREIRSIVIASVNNQPVKVDDVVEGGPLCPARGNRRQGVVVGHQTRLGQVGVCRPEARRHGPRGEGRPRQRAVARRGRQGAEHRAPAAARAVAARLARRQGEGQGAEREPRPAPAGRQDRALLRPHGTDRRDHGNGPREPAPGDRAGRGRVC